MDFLGYRKLNVYQQAREIVKQVYALIKNFPKEEQFALSAQLRRAAVSITSNIAEGTSRYSYKDKVHFLEMSFGSLMEVMSQLEIAEDLGYITMEQRYNMEIHVVQVAQMLTNLQYSFMPKDEKGTASKPFQQKVNN